jgi:hypothetical protein
VPFLDIEGADVLESPAGMWTDRANPELSHVVTRYVHRRESITNLGECRYLWRDTSHSKIDINSGG